MEKERVLIFQGGWPGHRPEEVARMLERMAHRRGHGCGSGGHPGLPAGSRKTSGYGSRHSQLDHGSHRGRSAEKSDGGGGTGDWSAGLHGGMGDAFREATEFQYMVGGQFVAHPEGIPSPIGCASRTAATRSLRDSDFDVVSELYYMHVDPAIRVLAETTAHNGAAMPVAWVKSPGEGRVFYCSLGHTPDVLRIEEVKTMVVRGMKWASRKGKERRG